MKCPVIYDSNTKIWSNPFKVLPPKICLGQRILEKLNQNDPNKIIEVNYDNGEKLTSGQLKTLVITAAQNLLNLGIKKGDVVLFFNSLNSLTTPIVFACYIIGAAICPMELLLGDDDADYVIKQLNPTVILYDKIFKSRIELTIERINLLNLQYVLSFESNNDGKSVPEMLCKPVKTIDIFEGLELGDPDKIVAALILTSGTTGKPKIICLSHSQISFGVNSYWKTDYNSVVYVPTSFRWITPVIFMLSPIFDNSTRVFSGQIATPEICVDLIRKYQVTHFFVVVGLSTKILQYAEKNSLGSYLKTLHYISIAGEPIPQLLHILIKRLIPESNFLKCYGMTELAGCITTNESVPNKNFDGGYLFPGFSIKIKDDKNNALGPNEYGIVYIKRIAPHLKYLNNDKANLDAFTNDGWFITGDYGKFDNENLLYIYNRYKDLIRCDQCILIPSVLEKYLEDHEAVETSYIVGIPGISKGEIPVAFIKLNSNIINDNKSQKVLKDDVKEFLTKILPSNQLTPEKIYFLENFPYTSCGKIDKMKLKEQLMENRIN